MRRRGRLLLRGPCGPPPPAGAAAAQTRNVGPGVPERAETARPRPSGDLSVLGGAARGERQVGIVGARGGRARRGIGSTGDLLAARPVMPYGSSPRSAPRPPGRGHAAETDGPVDPSAGEARPRFGSASNGGTGFGRGRGLSEEFGFGGTLRSGFSGGAG